MKSGERNGFGIYNNRSVFGGCCVWNTATKTVANMCLSLLRTLVSICTRTVHVIAVFNVDGHKSCTCICTAFVIYCASKYARHKRNFDAKLMTITVHVYLIFVLVPCAKQHWHSATNSLNTPCPTAPPASTTTPGPPAALTCLTHCEQNEQRCRPSPTPSLFCVVSWSSKQSRHSYDAYLPHW